MHGPMWAGLTPDSKGDPTGDTEEPDRRRQETPHLSARRKGALPASPGGPPSTGQKKLRVLNPIPGSTAKNVNNAHNVQRNNCSSRGRHKLGCWKVLTMSLLSTHLRQLEPGLTRTIYLLSFKSTAWNDVKQPLPQELKTPRGFKMETRV